MKSASSARLAILALLLASCARKAPPMIRNAPAPDAGRSSFRFVPDPDAPKPNLLPDERFIPPSPIGELAPPPYPDEALRAHAAPATVAVRIIVDEQGDVTRVVDSPLLASTQGPWSEVFRARVEEAVRGWHLEPAEIRRLAPGNDLDGDGEPDYKMVVSRAFVSVHLDVQFTFEIVNGTGQVRTTSAPE